MASVRVALVLLIACGGNSKRAGTWQPPPQGRAERTIGNWTTADEDTYIRLSCQNIVVDGALRCPILQRIGLKASNCSGSLDAFRASTTKPKEREAFRLIIAGLSTADSCETVDATLLIAAKSLEEAGPLVESTPQCPRRQDNAYDLTGEQMLQRRGLGDRTFADTPSTADAPIEVCGLEGELRYLTRLTCADGSRPWGNDLEKAHKARTGSLTGKGWCPGEEIGKPIDNYRVPCPEKEYEVYMNMYMCGPGEHLRR